MHHSITIISMFEVILQWKYFL